MDKVRVEICMGSSCHSRGNYQVAQLLRSFQQEDAQVEVVGSLCANRCSDGPIVKVDGRMLSKVGAATLRAAMDEALEIQNVAQDQE